MRHFYILMILLGLFSNKIFAQETTRSSNNYTPLPYYNFKKGIGITSPDSIFQLNMRFRMQNRATYFHTDNQEDNIQAEVRRLRLRFDGYIANPKFMYTIQLSFAPGDTRGEISVGDNLHIIRDAVVFYKPNKNWVLSFGQTKLPGNRQRVNSSGALQFTDRSINNASFNIDRDFGFQVHYLKDRKEDFSYNIKAAISTGEGRNETKNPDTGLGYTGKIELFPLGSFAKDGSFFEGDLVREQKPKLMLSGAYMYNDNANKTKGTTGSALYESRDMSSLLLDAMFKYKGLAFMAAYMNRMSDNPVTINPNDPTKSQYVYAGEGMDYQLSYLFDNDYEILTRYSYINVDKDIFSLTPNRRQYSLGINKYIWEHAFKIQAEVTYDQSEYYNGNTKNGWYVRMQVEIGI
ncbi:MAG: porin [Bacteroidota bacterium]|nr:porin [Bacteroidota bacterium]